MKQHFSAATGIQAVHDLVGGYDIHPSQDGLEFVPPTDLSRWKIEGIVPPKRLKEFLDDIRCLKRIPLSYLIPDPDLLPPESVRFFHVNQTWVDRVIDGVFSNTNIGTVDFHYSLTTLQLIRAAVDPAPSGMTGILIRSELARRWPKMIVRAYSSTSAGVDDPSTVDVLRAEPISRDIFIALFAGQPRRIHIREPFEGVRYGVETGDDGKYVVDQRNADGKVLNDDEPIPLRSQSKRTVNVSAFQTQLAARAMGDSRGVALHLEQRPFVQIFIDNVSESKGSVSPPPDVQVALKNGRLFSLEFATQALFQL